MPCYQVQTVSVEFKVAHADLLDKALDALEWTPVWIGTRKICRLSGGIELNLETGKATLPDGMQSKLNELKRAYSHQAVKLAAKMNGWTVQAKGLNKLQVMRGAL